VVPKHVQASFARCSASSSVQWLRETTFQATTHSFPLQPKLHCLPASDLAGKPNGYTVDAVAIVLQGRPTPGPVPAVMTELVTGTGDTLWVRQQL